MCFASQAIRAFAFLVVVSDQLLLQFLLSLHPIQGDNDAPQLPADIHPWSLTGQGDEVHTDMGQASSV